MWSEFIYMDKNMQQYTHFIKKQLDRLIKNVSVKSLFSGYGFYQDNHMFGIAQRGIFYLRAEYELAALLEQKGALPCISSDNNNALSLSRYYRLPRSITSNDNEYQSLILQSIEQIKQQKIEFALSKKTRIKELLNLGIKHERLLLKVGISNVSELRQTGIEMAYILMKKQGFSITLEFYWNLVAALKNIPVSLLPADQRKQALIKLNQYLKIEGMRSEKG